MCVRVCACMVLSHAEVPVLTFCGVRTVAQSAHARAWRCKRAWLASRSSRAAKASQTQPTQRSLQPLRHRPRGPPAIPPRHRAPRACHALHLRSTPCEATPARLRLLPNLAHRARPRQRGRLGHGRTGPRDRLGAEGARRRARRRLRGGRVGSPAVAAVAR